MGKLWRINGQSPNSPMFSPANVLRYTVCEVPLLHRPSEINLDTYIHTCVQNNAQCTIRSYILHLHIPVDHPRVVDHDALYTNLTLLLFLIIKIAHYLKHSYHLTLS